MDSILAAASILTGVVFAVTKMIKNSVPNKKYLPIFNVFIGVVLGVAYAASFANGEIILYAWGGALAGLAAGGFYDLGSGILKGGE